MSISHFASYLFGLWAFDVLLVLQVAVIVLGVAGRPYAQYLARVKTRRGRELNYSRRSFARAIAAIAGLIGIGVVVGSVKLPASVSTGSQTSTTTQTGVSKGAIANTNSIQVGQPVYFDYPTGSPSILMKNADGSLTALSLVCTHLCCHASYDGTSKAIRCPCHGSVFDLSGQVVSGPAVVSLPRIQLNVDGAGNVFPVGVSNPGPCHV
jgi:cytochrome b6-f complex iron-sulfur subunit